MTTNPILVRTNVRRSRPDDLPTNEGLLHCQSTIDGDATFFNCEPFTLTSKEEQTVHTFVLASRFREFGDKSEHCSRPSKDSLVIHPNGIYEDHLTDTNEDVVVILYEGPDDAVSALNGVNWGTLEVRVNRPASSASNTSNVGNQVRHTLFTAESKSFQRSWLSSSENGKSRRRWFKLQHVHEAPEDADWGQVLASLHRSIRGDLYNEEWSDQVHLCHLRVKISRRTISAQELAQCGNNAVRDCEISDNTGIPLYSIKKLAALNTAVNHTSPTQVHLEGSFMGTDLISVVQRSFCTDDDDSVYVLETPRTNLVYADKPCTLADVVSQRHHHQFSFLQSLEGVAMLNEEFGQVKVSIRIGKRTETRTIAGFREGKAGDAPLSLRHYAWSLRGEVGSLSNLPCVNVGTPAEPLLLPLELCTVLPSQRVRGAIDAPLSRLANRCRLSIAFRLQPNQFESTGGRVVAPSSSLNPRDTRHQKLSRACSHVFPNLLFVSASSTKVGSSNWKSLEGSVRAVIKESLEAYAAKYASSLLPVLVPTGESPRLSLSYEDDASLSDRWTEQLRKFVSDNGGSQDQLTLVIVYLPAEAAHTDMYKIIKKACDITVGAQTFFINHASLEARVCQSPSEGLSNVAAELRRRICLRNPPMMAAASLSQTSPEPKHLVIAMHISHVGFPSKLRIASGHVTDLYIVALVSSDLKTGGHYHTEMKLYSADQVNNLNMGELFQPFISSLPTRVRHEVTILRSGYFPERQVTSGTSNVIKAPTIPRSRDKTAKEEMLSIHRTFGQTVARRGFIYITLAEDKILNLRVDTADLKLPALVLVKDKRFLDKDHESCRVTHLHRQNVNTGVIAVTIHRPSLVTAAPTVNARPSPQHTSQLPIAVSKQRSELNLGRASSEGPSTPLRQADRLQGGPGSARSTAASPSAFGTPIKTTLNGDAASEFNSRISSSVHTPLPPDDEDHEEDMSVTTQRLGQMTLEIPEPELTEADAEFLAKLWDGQELELSGTKWPIVTHLAHLAVKRAHLHLGNNDWNGTATAPYFLPVVHPNVRHSLYYL